MARVRPTKIARKFFPGLTWNIPNEEKKIYLTFDDGPTPLLTNWILEELEKYNAKATFFVLGKNVEKLPVIYNNILEARHSVGSHSYSHPNGWKTRTRKYMQDVDLADSIICSQLYRPPYGKLKHPQLRKLNRHHRVIMWDVLSKDYSHKISKEQCYKNVAKFTKPGSIIVFHDSEKAKKNLVYALPKVMKSLHERGYVFEAISNGL